MDDAIVIREATAADSQGIARVLVDGWQTTYVRILPADFLASFTYDQHEAGTRGLLDSLPSSSAVFVAAEDGAVVGVAVIREVNEGNEFSSELDAIYVSPPMQRRGIGRRLVQRVLQWLDDRGNRSMLVWVLRDNPYRRFYEDLGGEFLNQHRDEELGAATVTSVAYGWRDLGTLRVRLDSGHSGQM